MAERTLTVRLSALTDQFKKAMQDASAETSRFAAASKGAFAGFGDELKTSGDQLTKKVSVPLLGLGTVATKLSMDFESTFAKMVGLADVAAGEVDGLKKNLLDLAVATGRGPQDIAEGMYAASSAGYDTATALKIVEASAKGATAGLGSTENVVNAVTNALGAYGTANITAAEAVDILTAGAKVSKVEASELAPQLGRLLPTAQALGVGFDQVVAAMGYLSQKSGDASFSATQLDGVLRKLLVPSEQGRKALEQVGLSADQLRQVVSTGGLPAALDLLRQKFGGNSDALFQLFDDIQAFQGAQALLADSTGSLNEVFATVANSTGQTGKAFDEVAKTDAFKFRQALTEAKVAVIQLGATLSPFVAFLAQVGGAFLGAFGQMPDWLKSATVGFFALVAAVGPIMSITGRLMENFSKLASLAIKAFDAMAVGAYNAAGALSTVGAAMLGIGAIVAGIAYTWVDNARRAREAEDRVRGYTDAIREAGDVASGMESKLRQAFEAGSNDRLLRDLVDADVSMKAFADAVAEGGDAVTDLKTKVLTADVARLAPPEVRRELDLLGVTVDDLAARVVTGEKSFTSFKGATPSGATQAFYGELVRLAKELDTTTSETAKAAERAGLLDKALGDTSDSASDAGSGASAAAGGVDALGSAASDAEARLKAMLSTLDGLYASAFDVLDAQIDFSDALADVDTAGRSTGGTVRDLTSEQRSLERATRDVTDAQQGLADAEQALAEARLGPSDREKEDASWKVRDAELGLAEAKRRVADAQKKVTEEQAKGSKGDAEGAALDLQRAQLQLEQAQRRVTDATDEQNDVLTSGEETSKKVTTAVDNVTAANQRLAEAQQRVTDAEASMRKEAATGGPVADRHRQIASAIDRVIEAGDKLIGKMVEQKRPIEEIAGQIDLQRDALQKLIDKYGDANGKLKIRIDLLLLEKVLLGGANLDPYRGTDGIFADLNRSLGISGRASGGPVQAGTPYMVGEEGVELFVPERSGRIVPTGQLVASTAYQASGPVRVVERVVHHVETRQPLQLTVDGRQLTEAILDTERRYG